MDRTHRQRSAERLAWITLGYTVLVILWGAVVRATGAGAGCGASWPTCNGEVIPMNPSLNTMIEFGHRVTSGIALPLVIWMAVRAWRAFPRGSGVRRAAGASVFFMVLEAAIGAALVLLEYVALDTRTGRALWMAIHLVNTFFLLAALALAAWTARGHALPRFRGASGARIALALGAVVVLGASGAITALGDTLVLVGGMSPAESALVAVLVELRVLHPALAFVAMGAVLWATLGVRPGSADRQRPLKANPPLAYTLGVGVTVLFAVQMGLGALNVWLLAPLWMQVVHLLVTDAIWIGLVLFAAEALGAPRAARAAAPEAGRALAAA